MEAVSKRLGVPREKVYVNLEAYGNTSAASIPIALDEAIRSGRCTSGMLVGMVAFGGGFTWAAAVARL
jgi:3-oxoacyl-[acyl-carrier-protein] synthase-3